MSHQTTGIFNEITFYPALIKDMLKAENEVIIYSPFVSKYRAGLFRKTLLKLKSKNVHVFLFTRPVEEHEEYMQEEIKLAIREYEVLGAQVTYIIGSIHEKVAIIDRKVLWEGSLNILSQKNSKELMMRMDDANLAGQVLANLNLNQKLIKEYKLKNQPHNLRLSFGLKIKIIIIEPALFTTKWLLTATLQVIIVLLRGILTIFNIVGAILR